MNGPQPTYWGQVDSDAQWHSTPPVCFTQYDLRTPEQKQMDNEDNLKITINTFVWQHAPGGMTLDKAEEMACKIFELFLEAHKETP